MRRRRSRGSASGRRRPASRTPAWRPPLHPPRPASSLTKAPRLLTNPRAASPRPGPQAGQVARPRDARCGAATARVGLLRHGRGVTAPPPATVDGDLWRASRRSFTNSVLGPLVWGIGQLPTGLERASSPLRVTRHVVKLSSRPTDCVSPRLGRAAPNRIEPLFVDMSPDPRKSFAEVREFTLWGNWCIVLHSTRRKSSS